jgi:transposase-like protein
MHTPELNLIRQNITELFADEIVDLKKDIDREALNKTEAKDALHKVIDKERSESRYCDHCGSVHVVKNGKTPVGRQKYMCKDCGKSYSDTRNSIIASSKKPYHVWESFIVCMMNEFTLRKTAKLIGISLPTAQGWRHKVMEAMGMYDLGVSLSGKIQVDETYFNLNMKGYKKLPRPPKKRKTRSYKKGLNSELVSVVSAIDEHDSLLIEIAGAGNPGADSIIATLDGRVKHGSALTTDSKSAYLKVAKHFNSEIHQIPSGLHTDGAHNLGEVNEVHSRLKSWMVQFKGVSSRHLKRYLNWFRFKRLLNYRKEPTRHNRFTMNYSIKEWLKFLISSIYSTPFPIDIHEAYS